MCATQTVGVQNHLNPFGHTQLVKNPEQVILDCVLSQAQPLGNLAVGQSFRHAAHDFLFPAGEQFRSPRINHTQRQRFA